MYTHLSHLSHLSPLFSVRGIGKCELKIQVVFLLSNIERAWVGCLRSSCAENEYTLSCPLIIHTLVPLQCLLSRGHMDPCHRTGMAEIVVVCCDRYTTYICTGSKLVFYWVSGCFIFWSCLSFSLRSWRAWKVMGGMACVPAITASEMYALSWPLSGPPHEWWLLLL